MEEVLASTVINGRYRVLKKLGEGGMGRVYLVEDTHREDALLALKILPEAADEEFLERFRAEFAQLAKLRHPNIASTYDFGKLANTEEHFFTSDYIRGIDLFKGTDNASVDQVLDIIAQLLRGLDFIHSHGFLHNDLKPSNVLLEPPVVSEGADEHGQLMKLEATVFGVAGRVKIIDFGLLSQENVAWRRLMGTPSYMSPERIFCKTADRRSDLYSLGCILYLLCARQLPFLCNDIRLLLKMHLEMPAPSILGLCPTLAPALGELIHKLLNKDPSERFESAGAVLKFLGEAFGWDKNTLVMRAKTPEITAGSLFHRGPEIALLEHCFRDAAMGLTACPCWVVEGPAGIGKSRLVNELRGFVQVNGGAFIQIGGRGIEGHLQPALEAILEGLETSGASGLDQAREAIDGLAGNPSVDLHYSLEKIVFEFAERMPLLIHFDDFQRASPTFRRFTMEMVHSACEKGRQKIASALMIVICRRAEDEGGDLHLTSLPTLKLEPFNSVVTREFIHRIYGQDDIPEDILWTLEKTTHGNAGLLVEVAKDLVEKNFVKYSGSRWVFPPSLSGVSLPNSISNALEKKIAGMDRDSVKILELLSISRLPVPARVIKRALIASEQDILSALNQMLLKGVLVAEEKEGLRRFGFAHPSHGKMIEEKLSQERRKFIHQRLAQSLEEEYGDRPLNDEGLCEVLAHHWLEAGNDTGFLRYAPSAASHLQKRGNLELAAEYHRRIVDGMPPEAVATKIKSLARLSEMHEFLWDLEKSRQDLEEILGLGGHLIQANDRASLLRRLAGMEVAQHRTEKAVEIIEEARRSLPSTPDPALELSLDALEAWARWFHADPAGSKAALERAEKTLRGLELTDARQKTLAVGAVNHLANLHHQTGRLSIAEEMYEQNLALLSEVKLPQAEAATLCSLGSVFLEMGRPDEALERLNLALELARKIGDRRTLCRTRERLGEYHLRHGDLKSALQITQVGLEDAQMVHNPSATANSLRTLGKIHLRAGQLDAAASALERALKTHEETSDPIGAPLSRISLARLRLEEGDFPEALELLEKASEEAQRNGLSLSEGLSRLLRAEAEYSLAKQVALSLTCLPLAPPREIIQSAEEILRSGGYLPELCEAKLLHARFSLEKGDVELAAKELAQIGPMLERAGSLEQRAQGQYLNALIDAARGRESDALKALSYLEQVARDSILPQIAKRCRESAERLSQAIPN